MNCKPGDIARIIHLAHAPELEGRLVEVLRAAEQHETMHLRRFGPAWIVKSLCRLPADCTEPSGRRYRVNLPAGEELAAPDAWLRPIRPTEGEDETLSWARLGEECPF